MTTDAHQPDDPPGPEYVRLQVRVPVVFDHLNVTLRTELIEREIQVKQALGRGAEIVGDRDHALGKFEVWFEVRGEADSDGIREACDRAVALVEDAVPTRAGLAPTSDARGLVIVPAQVVTTALVVRGMRPALPVPAGIAPDERCQFIAGIVLIVVGLPAAAGDVSLVA